MLLEVKKSKVQRSTEKNEVDFWKGGAGISARSKCTPDSITSAVLAVFCFYRPNLNTAFAEPFLRKQRLSFYTCYEVHSVRYSREATD